MPCYKRNFRDISKKEKRGGASANAGNQRGSYIRYTSSTKHDYGNMKEMIKNAEAELQSYFMNDF